MRPLMEAAGNLPFAGPSTFCRFPHTRDLEGVQGAIMGAPLDTTVSYRPGARFGPRGIRDLSIFVLTELANLRHYQGRRLIDWGDTWFAPGDVAHAHFQIEQDASKILDSGAFLLTLGGDHSITLPLLRAHAKKHGPLALLQFDSHTDLYDVWPQVYHGSMMARALDEGLLLPHNSLQLGIRTDLPANASDEVQLPVMTADEVEDLGPARVADAIRSHVGNHPMYLSFDIDFLDPAYAPGTGTPVIGGATTQQARRILRALKGLNVVGGDVVELCPPYDPPGHPTALAAASMAFYILELLLFTACPAEP